MLKDKIKSVLKKGLNKAKEIFKKIKEWFVELFKSHESGRISKQTKTELEIMPSISKSAFHIKKVEATLIEYSDVKMMTNNFIEQYFADILKNELKIHITAEELPGNKMKYKAYTYIAEEEVENADDFVYKVKEIK